MDFRIPQYIKAAEIQDTNVTFLWDDWKGEEVIGDSDASFVNRLSKISQRANATFCLAILEWILYRFGSLVQDPFIYQYLEVAWAMTIDERYSKVDWDSFIAEDWHGAVKGSIISGIYCSIGAIQQMEDDGNVPNETGKMSKLSMHVISNPTHFIKWQEWALQRLEVLYPFNEEDGLGEVVPREVYDPECNFEISQTDVLINQFLKKLNPDKNPYLSSPDFMIECGFEGTPYIFDIEKDRIDRIEW